MPSPSEYDDGEDHAAGRGRLAERQGEDGPERRADARGPAEPEDHAEQRRAPHARLGRDVHAPLALHERHRAEEDEAHHHDEHPEDAGDGVELAADARAEGRERHAQDHEHRGESRHEHRDAEHESRPRRARRRPPAALAPAMPDT